MNKQDRTTHLETRLLKADRERFEALAKSRGVTKTELLREAALFFLDHHESLQIDQRESRLERRIKAIEDRYASLLVRIGIDVGTLMALLSSRIDSTKRKQTMDSAYKAAVAHFNRKLEGVAREMKQSLREQQ